MNEITAAQLDVLAGKARLLAERYRVGALSDSDMAYMVAEIQTELNRVDTGRCDRWDLVPRVADKVKVGMWFPDDK